MQGQRDADSELHRAVREGSLLRVEKALADTAATRANVNARGRATIGFRYGETPLRIACTYPIGYSSLEIVRALLNAGADPNARDNLGSTALHRTVCCFPYNEVGRERQVQTVEALLDANADVNARDNQNSTPLHDACRNDASDHVVRLLLNAGADSNLRDEDGATPLHHACRWGDVELVRLLLNSGGADLEPIDSEGYSPLLYASRSGRLQVVRALIEQFGADMFVKDQDDCTPFDLAMNGQETQVAEYLFERYREGFMERHGRLSLHAILQEATYDMNSSTNRFMILPIGSLNEDHTLNFLTDLIAQETDPVVLVCNDAGDLPIHIACHTGAPARIIGFLAEQDAATISMQNRFGALPIHTACGSGAPIEVVQLLVQRDVAMLHVADRSGALPLHVACRAGASLEMIRFLVQQGGIETLGARDNNLALPLHLFCASSRASLDAVKYLLKADPNSVSEMTLQRDFPLMLACESSASESVIFTLLREYPEVVDSKRSSVP